MKEVAGSNPVTRSYEIKTVLYYGVWRRGSASGMPCFLVC